MADGFFFHKGCGLLFTRKLRAWRLGGGIARLLLFEVFSRHEAEATEKTTQSIPGVDWVPPELAVAKLPPPVQKMPAYSEQETPSRKNRSVSFLPFGARDQLKRKQSGVWTATWNPLSSLRQVPG